MKYVYAKAPAVEAVARRLIGRFHGHLAEEGVRIEYLFVDPPPESRGKVVLGKCSKITGKAAFLASMRPEPLTEEEQEGEQPENDQTPFFVVEIAEKAWVLMDDAAREALVDHELCHAGVTRGEHGELKLSIIPHDVEEFACIVERHGLWEQQVRDFVEAAIRNAPVVAA